MNKKEIQKFQNSSFQHFQKEVFCFSGLDSKSTLKNIPLKKKPNEKQTNEKQTSQRRK